MADMNVQKSTKLNFSELVHPFSAKMEAVNRLIRERMASRHAPRIPEVTAHLVESGGKRLRPTLTLAAAGLYDYEGDFDVYLAATVEFLHTATLLHDDVVDESEMRRGRATANLLWDNKSSVLVGDYLFSRAFQLMVETGSLRVLDILANASGTIAEGEVLAIDIGPRFVNGRGALSADCARQDGDAPFCRCRGWGRGGRSLRG